MSLLDLVLVVIIGLSVVTGFVAGFARVGISFLATIFGLLFGFWFYGIPAAYLHKFIQSTTVCNLIGFFLVFWAILIVGALIAKFFAGLLKWTGLTWLDRFMGGVFGAVRGALIAAVFVTVLMAFTSKPLPNWMVNSKLLPYALNTSNMLASLAPSGVKDAFRDSLAEIRKAWDEELKRAKDKLEHRERESEEKQRKLDHDQDRADERGDDRPSNPKKTAPKHKESKKDKDKNVGRSFDF